MVKRKIKRREDVKIGEFLFLGEFYLFLFIWVKICSGPVASRVTC